MKKQCAICACACNDIVIFMNKKIFIHISIWRRAVVTMYALLAACALHSQITYLSLEQAVQLATKHSLDAQLAKFNYTGAYWTFRSFKAELLPSINLGGNLLNYNHSKVETRNYDTGEINYVENNTLDNDLTLSIDQNVPLLGGKLSVQSYLYRLDQFDYDRTMYNSQPLRLQYTQPLRTYNELKWRKKTEPVAYDKAKRIYMEALQAISIRVTTLYFNVLSAQSRYRQAEATLRDRQRLYEQAKKRYELTTLSKSELLQLELSLLNAKIESKNMSITLDSERFALFTYLGASNYEGVDLVAPTNVPDLLLNSDDVIQKAYENSSHNLSNRLQTLKSEQLVAQAKSQRGIQLTLRSEVGLSKTGYSLNEAYRRLNDNEIIGISLSLPLFDWGVSKGRVKVAEANLDVLRTELEIADEEFRQKIRTDVKIFNAQCSQHADTRRMLEIAEERYDLTLKRFENGGITVTDLNTAQQELDNAKAQYISQLSDLWTSYYEIQKATLHDFRTGHDLDCELEQE